jgi:hypothetical protein
MAGNRLHAFVETLAKGLVIGAAVTAILIIVILILLAVFQPSFGSR